MSEADQCALPARRMVQRLPLSIPVDIRKGPAPRRVLVVEDDAIMADVICDELTSHGFEVVATAARAEDGVALARLHAPDIVLLDVRLAGPMDGIEAAAAILAEKDLHIVFVTAHTDPGSRARMAAVGPHRLVPKPYTTDQLIGALRALDG